MVDGVFHPSDSDEPAAKLSVSKEELWAIRLKVSHAIDKLKKSPVMPTEAVIGILVMLKDDIESICDNSVIVK